MTDLPAAAITADPNPEGNPALAAATEAIIRRRLHAVRWSNADHEAHRAAVATEALADAAVALNAAAPHLAAAAWRDGYGKGRDDEADGLPLATGEADFTGTADPTTETEGFRAYKAGLAAGRAEGAAAERQRIRQLAAGHNAQCQHPDGGGGAFASLLEDAP